MPQPHHRTSVSRPASHATKSQESAVGTDALFKGAAGCIGFLMTLLSVASLSVIAAGVFWTAQQMDKITDETHTMLLQLEGFYKGPE